VAWFVATMLKQTASWRQDLKPALASAVVTRLLGDQTIRLGRAAVWTASGSAVQKLTCRLDEEKAEEIRSRAVSPCGIEYVVDAARAVATDWA